jgi:hypothetical protein
MTTKTERIRALNDALRTKGIGGRILLTTGIAALANKACQQVLSAVQAFDAFTPDNDPLGEHDFAVLIVAGERIMFKIDYYDRTMTYGSPDAADPQQTTRVLTIMLVSEY